jgi:pyruvate formate lyase activating enzyme
MEYFKIDAKNKMVCQLCRHYCTLKENGVGICGVNKNENGVFKNLVYNHPSTIHIDPVEKKPLYHFLPSTDTLSFGTVGCNFKCPFCQNWQISQTHSIDENIVVTKEQMVALALKQGSKSISYTYNEPTIFYPYAKDVGLFAKEHGLKNIFVTNGFESPEVIEDMASWVDAANVDLKSFTNEYYKKSLKGGLDEVKDTLKLMIKNKIWVEITTLIIDEINSSKDELKEMAEFILNELGSDVPWHLSAFHPDYKMSLHSPTKLKSLTDGFEIAKSVGIKYVYLGNVPVPSETHCPNCNEVLIKRNGFNVVKNILNNGKCPKCNTNITGVWS